MKHFLRQIKTGVWICILFAGLAGFEYTRTKEWTGVAFFGILALVFVFIDGGKREAARAI